MPHRHRLAAGSCVGRCREWTASFLDAIAARFVGSSIAYYQIASILGVGGMGMPMRP